MALLSVMTSTFEIKGKGEGKKTAGKVLGGAGLGALLADRRGGAGAAIGVVAVPRAERACRVEER